MKMQSRVGRRLGWAFGVFAILVLALVVPASSQAFPGANGRIAYPSVRSGPFGETRCPSWWG